MVSKQTTIINATGLETGDPRSFKTFEDLDVTGVVVVLNL